MKLKDIIIEPKNFEEVKIHLQQGKLCMQKLSDATVLYFKNKELLSIYAIKSNGQVEPIVGIFDIAMKKMKEGSTGELPTLLNVTQKHIDTVLETIIVYELGLRKLIK